MLNWLNKHKLDQANDGTGGAGGSGAAPKPEVPAAQPPSSAAPAEAPGDDKYDELGYEKVSPAAAEGNPKPEAKPGEKPESKEQAEKVEDPATGYGEKPPVVEEEKPATPPVEPVVDPELDVKVDPSLPKADVETLKAFAKANKLSKEQAQAVFDLRKNDLANQTKAAEEAKKNYEREVAKTRITWDKELREDPAFGGENFAHNIHQAEKVLKDFLPGTKKVLTERGTMLPPYVMRDLAKLASHLYSTEPLKQGDPAVPEKTEQEKDDALGFYT